MEFETFQSPYGLDYTALLLWALSGAIVARRKRLEIGLFIIVRLLAIRYNWRSLAVNEWRLTPLELGDLEPQQLTRRLGRRVRPEGQVDEHELR